MKTATISSIRFTSAAMASPIGTCSKTTSPTRPTASTPHFIPDGGYRIKVVASDSPSHSPGEALTGAKESERFEIDTTPPVVNGLHAEEALAKCAQAPCSAPVHVTFDAEDAASPISQAEYALDAGTWQYIDPVGKLSDSKT